MLKNNNKSYPKGIPLFFSWFSDLEDDKSDSSGILARDRASKITGYISE
jgi:hypothetical protein